MSCSLTSQCVHKYGNERDGNESKNRRMSVWFYKEGREWELSDLLPKDDVLLWWTGRESKVIGCLADEGKKK